MASSKKPQSAKDRSALSGPYHGPIDLSRFTSAVLDALLTTPSPQATKPRLALAYSGGVDSTVLLHVLAHLQQQGQLEVIALHVHHGLSPHADAWLEHCQQTCANLHVPFAAARVQLKLHGQSIEAEARQARYSALQSLCGEHQTSLLLTAHHADDQAETILLNLLRGAGVAGLAGAAKQRALGSLTLLRPFQHLPAAALRQLALQEHWPFIEDESNHDRRFTRNALRHEVMPVLKRIFPAVNTRLAQTAAHSAEAQTLLDDIGREDLQQMQAAASETETNTDSELHIEGLRQLSRPRAANALRVWFRSQARYVPSTAAFSQMLDQLLTSRSDAQISLIHDDLALQVYRGRIYARPAVEAPAQATQTRPLVWQGESELAVPEWQGRLLFQTGAAAGIPARLLRERALSLRSRQGGERIKLHANRPSRSLKNLYQESGIPPWQRTRLPLLYADDQLIFAAGLGMDVRQLADQGDASDTDQSLTALAWQSD